MQYTPIVQCLKNCKKEFRNTPQTVCLNFTPKQLSVVDFCEISVTVEIFLKSVPFPLLNPDRQSCQCFSCLCVFVNTFTDLFFTLDSISLHQRIAREFLCVQAFMMMNHCPFLGKLHCSGLLSTSCEEQGASYICLTCV